MDVVEDFYAELARHALPAESCLNTGNRGFFTNASEPMSLPADLMPGPSCWRTEACLPLPTDEAAVEPVWRRFALPRARSYDAPAPALCTTHDARWGPILSPVSASGGRHVFTVPAGARMLCLRMTAAGAALRSAASRCVPGPSGWYCRRIILPWPTAGGMPRAMRPGSGGGPP